MGMAGNTASVVGAAQAQLWEEHGTQPWEWQGAQPKKRQVALSHHNYGTTHTAAV